MPMRLLRPCSRSAFLGALLTLLGLLGPAELSAQRVTDVPDVVLGGVPFTVAVELDGEAAYVVRDRAGGVLAEGTASGDTAIEDLVVTSGDLLPLTISLGGASLEIDPTYTPAWFSVIPPLIAIGLALLLREAVAALFVGVWIGAWAIAGFNPITGTWRVIDRFVVPTLGDLDGGHPQIVVFSLLLGGMVGIISRNGGTLGIVAAATPFARTRRRGKIATWLAGMTIFFDDYANTLIVGNTMRAITDRLKISREKLAYLVDSTAAPLAAIVPLSTWVGYEISLIADGLRIAAEQNPAAAEALLAANPFSVFIETIPYRFYPLLALYFAALTAFSRLDFGTMAAAEKRAASGGGLYRPGAQLAAATESESMQAKEGVEARWWNAGIPVLTVIVVVLWGLYATGRASAGPDAPLRDVFGAADPFATLLWGSLAGCVVAILLSAGQKILTIGEGVDAMVGGMRAMMTAMIILVLAWSLGLVTEELGTSQYLAQLLNERLPLALVPVTVFATAAAMSFATGTSWGTMAILLPLVIPLTVALGGYQEGFGETAAYSILLGSISSVLAGAIFGDHCSPISDTTVLSSMASGCDHIDHVRTQLPYALLVGVVGMLLGDIGTAYGLPIWVALGGGAVLLFVFLRLAGSRVEDET
ncbi:MAG: Na+/H+ antiporter NhaC family protein [Gemmatimonadota bacterium]|nr:Na+/H+ antiporter NhaC family protein [Gemmatimonadota bacterium]